MITERSAAVIIANLEARIEKLISENKKLRQELREERARLMKIIDHGDMSCDTELTE